jgi:uncharacterized protein with PQ loop repeat
VSATPLLQASDFGYLGAALGVIMVTPQLVRLIRHPTLTGVSPLSWFLTSATCMLWLGYGVRSRELPQIPGNVLLICGAALVVLLSPARLPRRQRAVALILVAALATGFVLVLPAYAVGYLAFGAGLTASLPQLVASARDTDRSASGVSLSAWMLRAASQVCWLTYALLIGDRPIVVAATVTLTSALTLLALEARGRRRGELRTALQPVSRVA